jgi:hypothetical protein
MNRPDKYERSVMFIESFEDALDRRRGHRSKLKRGTKRQRRVARALANCRRQHRCGTEACRVCVREFRIGWVGEAIKIIAQRSSWVSCSVITEGLLVPFGSLSKFDLSAAIKRIRKRLERSEIRGRIVLGGLDLSLNLEQNKMIGWQFHLHILIEGANDSRLEAAVRKAFPPEPTALAPYNFAQVSNPLEVVTYTYKALIERRSGFVGNDGKHRIKNLPLKGVDIRELAPFLSKYKVGARLILGGVRRNGQRLVFTKGSIARPAAMKGKAQ